MPENSPEINFGSNGLPQVTAYFQILKIFGSSIPRWVQQENLGLFTPIRYDVEPEGPHPLEGKSLFNATTYRIDDGVEIWVVDRLDALEKAGKQESVQWWKEVYAPTGTKRIGVPRNVGRIISKEAKERFFPD